MAKLYAKAAAADARTLYNGLIIDTPALANGGMPFVALDGDIKDLEKLDSRVIGDLLYTNIDLANQFVPALLNKIVVTYIQSKYWENPWSSLEKGYFENGEIVEEVFIKMATPKSFSPKRAEQEVFKREPNGVLSAFHKMNYQYYYKRTISLEQLRSAFLSWEALDKFIRDLIQSMYTSANYDVQQSMMYLVARALLDGFIATHQIPAPITDRDSARSAVAAARGISNLLTQMLPNYNYYNLPNYADYSDQVIILDAMVEGQIDVDVLSAAFNMDKATFLSMHRLITPGFGRLDHDRLAVLFADDPTYQPLTEAEQTLLNGIPFVIFDRNWFQFYDKLNVMVNINNPEGLYWNWDYHVWKILGVSPFTNAVAFTDQAPGISSVAVTPSAITVSPGQSAVLKADVTTTGFGKKSVVWTSNNANVTVDQSGHIKVAAEATGTATITATSTVNNTKKGTATVTIA